MCSGSSILAKKIFTIFSVRFLSCFGLHLTLWTGVTFVFSPVWKAFFSAWETRTSPWSLPSGIQHCMLAAAQTYLLFLSLEWCKIKSQKAVHTLLWISLQLNYMPDFEMSTTFVHWDSSLCMKGVLLQHTASPCTQSYTLWLQLS